MTKKRVFSVLAIIFGLGVLAALFTKFWMVMSIVDGQDKPAHEEYMIFSKDLKDIVTYFKYLGKDKVGLCVNLTKWIALITVAGGLGIAVFGILNMVIPEFATPFIKIISIVEIFLNIALLIAGVATMGASFYQDKIGGVEGAVFLMGYSGYFSALICSFFASIFGMIAGKKVKVAE